MIQRLGTYAYVPIVLAWLAIVITGFAMLTIYSHTPGALGTPPSLDQAELSDVAWRRSAEGKPYHLVMAIHPQCPCTLASVSQLERLMAKCGEEVACTVLVFQPSSKPTSWNETTLVANARRMPRTEVVIDQDGEQAKKMQLKTSGAVVLYNDEGDSLFWGGITPSRGHEGDSLGFDSILSFVRTGSSTRKSCSVYGCSLERQGGHAPSDRGEG